MAKRKDDFKAGRRKFLKGATLAGAGALTAPLAASAQDKRAPTPARAPSIPPAPNREAERGTPPDIQPLTQSTSGGDFMVDVMRGLGIEHAAAFVGSSFRGIHESLINHGMLSEPRIDYLSCMHEEVSVAMCHGYAKIAGKPMAAMMHDTVGLQHGSMAIYNAYADRVPIFLITASAPDLRTRKTMVQFVHSVQDGAAIVRDFVKWDDQPASAGRHCVQRISDQICKQLPQLSGKAKERQVGWIIPDQLHLQGLDTAGVKGEDRVQ